MNQIKKEVSNAIAQLNIKAIEISDNQGNKILDEICILYTEIGAYRFQLWDYLTNDVSIRNPAAWTWISDFVGSNSSLLFFEWVNEPCMFLFEKGSDIISVLSECHEFVFYVTDVNLKYLLCFNDHDYLIGCGDAREWLLSLNK